MSIILEGGITNKLIQGANGEFSVGNFCTGIGQFKIKDPLLDQFEEGDYQVRVSVVKLKLNTYVVQRTGITITEIVAEIDAIDVIEADIKPVEAESVEQDASVDDNKPVKPSAVKPAEQVESKVSKPAKTTKEPSKVSKPVKPADSNADKIADPAELFGYLWPLADTVKLDKTAPRPLIIQQKDYLYNAGYSFDLKTQIWSKADGEKCA